MYGHDVIYNIYSYDIEHHVSLKIVSEIWHNMQYKKNVYHVIYTSTLKLPISCYYASVCFTSFYAIQRTNLVNFKTRWKLIAQRL